MFMFVLGRYELNVELFVWKFVFMHVESKATINAPFNCIMFVTKSFISALLHDTGSLIHALHAFIYVYIARTLPASNKTSFCAMGM